MTPVELICSNFPTRLPHGPSFKTVISSQVNPKATNVLDRSLGKVKIQRTGTPFQSKRIQKMVLINPSAMPLGKNLGSLRAPAVSLVSKGERCSQL